MRRLAALGLTLALSTMGVTAALAADTPDAAAPQDALDKEMSKLDEALAAESEVLAGDIAALDAVLARGDVDPKVREKAEKMRAKREASGASITRVKADAEAARGRKDGAAKVRGAQNQSKQRLVLLKMDSADVRKWAAKVGGGATAGAPGAAAKDARPGVLASCEVPFSGGGEKAQLELDGKPPVALPATLRVVSGRHRAVVHLGNTVRPLDVFLVCGATDGVVIPPS